MNQKTTFDDLLQDLEEDLKERKVRERVKPDPLFNMDDYVVQVGAKYYISGEWYVLANTGVGFTLISVSGGNRWSDPPLDVKTGNNGRLTIKDFKRLLSRDDDEINKILNSKIPQGVSPTWPGYQK